MINRRSFFGLIGGAVASSAVVKAAPAASQAPVPAAIPIGAPRAVHGEEILRDGFCLDADEHGQFFRFEAIHAAPFTINQHVSIHLGGPGPVVGFTGVVHRVRVRTYRHAIAQVQEVEGRVIHVQGT